MLLQLLAGGGGGGGGLVEDSIVATAGAGWDTDWLFTLIFAAIGYRVGHKVNIIAKTSSSRQKIPPQTTITINCQAFSAPNSSASSLESSDSLFAAEDARPSPLSLDGATVGLHIVGSSGVCCFVGAVVGAVVGVAVGSTVGRVVGSVMGSFVG